MSTLAPQERRGTPFDQLVDRVHDRPRVVAAAAVVASPKKVVGKPVVTVTPVRSAEQRRVALEHANDVRLRRAGLKRDVRAGRVLAVDVLEAPPEWALTMKVWDVLIATPRWGRVRVERVLGLAGVSSSKTLGGMTPRRRAALVELLRARG